MVRLRAQLAFWLLAFSACQIDPTICTTGLTPCGQTECADTTQDVYNCGGCNIACGQSELCVNSVCVCESPGTVCGSTCALLAVDPLNCGACGTACASGQVCEQGACQAACTLGASCPTP